MKRIRPVAYDPNARSVSADRESVNDLSLALEIVSEYAGLKLGSTAPSLADEVVNWVRFRYLFMMLPERCLVGDPPQDKPLIRDHLRAIGVEPTDELVASIKAVCLNYRAKRD